MSPRGGVPGGDARQRAIDAAVIPRIRSQLGRPPTEHQEGFQSIEVSPDGQVPWRTERQGRSKRARRSPYPKGPGGLSSYELDSSPPQRPTESVIAESLDESVEALEVWTFEKVVEFAADAFHPGLGRVINIALKVKEVLGDVEALASPDSDRDLHVPVLHVAGGVEIDLNVHLPGQHGAGDGGPLVSGFVMPGDDGLFGGWAVEEDRRSEAEEERPRSDRDTFNFLEEFLARQAAWQADWAKRFGLNPPAEITYDLSKSVATTEPLRRAATMREAASRLRSRLHARPEFADMPILVVYDERAGLGMWMVKPGLPDAVAGQRIEIRLNLVANLMTVFIV
jgi:hypothetical protein